MKSNLWLSSLISLSTVLTLVGPNWTYAKPDRPESGGTVVHGGGGKAVVCRVPGQKPTVELLDLYEGREENSVGYNYSVFNTLSVNEMVDRATDFLSKSELIEQRYQSRDGWFVGSMKRLQSADSVKFFTRSFLDAIDNKQNDKGVNLANFQIKESMRLHPTQDSFEVFYPKNCEIEQVAVYQDYGYSWKLYVDYDLFKLMSPLNQAALIMHEAVYSQLHRDSGDFNSRRTRRLVSRIFALRDSDFLVPTINPREKSLECASDPKHLNPATQMDRYKFSAVRIVERGEMTEVYPLFLNGVKIIESRSGSASLSKRFGDLKKMRGDSIGLLFGAGEIERENKARFDITADKKGQIFMKVRAAEFTNGTEAFEETLVCQ